MVERRVVAPQTLDRNQALPPCPDCGEESHKFWWDCEKAGEVMNYGWKFA